MGSGGGFRFGGGFFGRIGFRALGGGATCARRAPAFLSAAAHRGPSRLITPRRGARPSPRSSTRSDGASQPASPSAAAPAES